MKKLNNRDQLLFANGHNSNYWQQAIPNSKDFKNGANSKEYKKARKKYETQLARFKKLLKETGANYRKELVRKSITEKSNILLRNTLENENQVLKFDKKMGEIDLPKLKKKYQINHPTENTKMGEIDPLLYSVNFPKTDRNKKHSCKVTNLDISMQKENSEYLCTEGVRFYKKYYNLDNLYKTIPEYFRKIGGSLSCTELKKNHQNTNKVSHMCPALKQKSPQVLNLQAFI